MSRKRLNRAEGFLSSFVVLFFVLVFLAGSPAVAGRSEGSEAPCAAAGAVDLDSGLRSFAGEGAVYRLTVPSAGILSVEVTVPGAAAAEPTLGLVACDSRPAAGPPPILERSATRLVMLAPGPGDIAVRVAPQDPSRPLGDFKLASRFVPHARSGPLLDKEGEDEGEIEIDAAPLIYAGGVESRSLPALLAELCRRGEVDDHGDSLTCATFLAPGSEASGEIHNAWGDDQDVFAFVVGGAGGADLWTVEIETRGGVDTYGGLYDRSGQRLEKAGDGGAGGNFRIVRTLRPGVYFVRVDSEDGGEGLYTLRVRASAG